MTPGPHCDLSSSSASAFQQSCFTVYVCSSSSQSPFYTLHISKKQKMICDVHPDIRAVTSHPPHSQRLCLTRSQTRNNTFSTLLFIVFKGLKVKLVINQTCDHHQRRTQYRQTGSAAFEDTTHAGCSGSARWLSCTGR